LRNLPSQIGIWKGGKSVFKNLNKLRKISIK
jgi:hypothetical protein